ncbi:DUF1648 domain-containing protein [Kineococcus sp. NBC_00420]|uniref:DUF1648 domain-containing protein n=1 Tax=unclassified Kineococcus TaxID=2621656 RepID=UPI002E1BBA75
MNGFEVGVGLASCLLVAVVLFLVPVLSAPTLPLGVSVPRARVGDPAVHRAVRRYRGAVAVLSALALVGAAAAGSVSAGPGVVTVPTYLLLVGGIVAFVLCRKEIREAKTHGDWYRDVPVRWAAPASPDDVPRAPVPIVWYAVAAALLVATAGFGVLRYPDLPDPFPTHWGGAGEPDAFAAKGFWSVFGPLVVAIGLLALLGVLTRLVHLAPVRLRADEAQPLARAVAAGRTVQDLLAVTAFLVTALVCTLCVDGWLHPARLELLVPALVVFGAGLVVATVVTTVGARGPREAAATDAVDDDRHWRGGMLYVNRDDPSLFVPKRVGVGYTINAGHPAGRAISIGVLVLVLAAIALPLLTT